ncbi:apolipoprotein L6-like [Saccostrea echinata]|uniref:apolipoprotein L6-like n=1 Tax=Saccostrea echinata TaxID=191078 RepID=UPI002A7F18B2|nr:apolipoprotein L6-like [Saccostrea echinata]
MAEEEIKRVCREWMSARKKTIRELRRLADDINAITKDSRIARVAGASTSVLGGIIATGCLIAAPFTGGISLLPAVAAGAFGGAGAVVTIGTSIAKTLLENGKITEVQRYLDEDKKFTEILISDLQKYAEYTEAALKGTRAMTAGAKFLIRLAGVGGEGGAQGLRFIARFGKAIGIVLSVAILPFDIYELVKSAIDIHNNNPSEASNEVRKIASQLEGDLKKIEQAYRESF